MCASPLRRVTWGDGRAQLLTEAEQKLVERIDFTLNTLTPNFHDVLQQSCAAAGPLTKSLLKRRAIPDVRLAHFTAPDRNVGRNYSHQEQFERNGTHGDDIFEHGHFLPYLRYFIYGPDLPAATIAGFCAIANDGLLTTGMQLDRLRAFVRAEVRKRGLDPHDAAEEFYKLAFECEMDRVARSVRDAALSARRK